MRCWIGWIEIMTDQFDSNMLGRVGRGQLTDVKSFNGHCAGMSLTGCE